MSDSCDPIDYSPPGSFVHGVLQARYWSELPFPSPGDLPDTGIEPEFPALQADSLPTESEAPIYALVVLKPAPHYTSPHYPLPVPLFLLLLFLGPHHS